VTDVASAEGLPRARTYDRKDITLSSTPTHLMRYASALAFGLVSLCFADGLPGRLQDWWLGRGMEGAPEARLAACSSLAGGEYAP